MATLKPTTPPLTHNKGPMEPASPLHPKNTPKTPISHPQRRWRFQTTRPPGRQSQAAAPADPEAMSGPAISHLDPPTRTLTRRHAHGPYNSHVNLMTCALATPPTCTSRGLCAYQRVNAHVQGLACEQHSTTGAVVPKARAQAPSIGGGIALHEAPTRRQHASRGLHVVQTPHLHRHGGRRRDSRAWPDNEPTRRATSAAKTPLVWRAPEGPEGTGGLRGAAPNEVRPPSLAGGRALRRPQHPWGHKQTSNNQCHAATRSVL